MRRSAVSAAALGAGILLAGCQTQKATQPSAQVVRGDINSDLPAAPTEGGLQTLKLPWPEGAEVICVLDSASAKLAAYVVNPDKDTVDLADVRNLLLDFESDTPGEYVMVCSEADGRHVVCVADAKTKRIVAYVWDAEGKRLRVAPARRDLERDLRIPARRPPE